MEFGDEVERWVVIVRDERWELRSRDLEILGG
jgi:hypothetical protein